MGSTADKLNYLKESVDLLKTTLINKGVDITDNTSLRECVEKVDTISGGVSIPMGVAFWIDGIVNMRDGSKNTSVLAMQNLCWADNGQATTGDREYIVQTNNVWDGNFLTLGNYGYYPYIYNAGGLSVEAYIKLTKEISTDISVLSTGSAGGWYLGTYGPRTMLFLARLGSSYLRLDDPTVLEIGKPYYVVATYKANNTITLTVIDENGNKSTTSTAFAGIMQRNRVNMGFGTQAYSSTSANGQRWDGLSIGMARVWTRALTDEEIQANYVETKERFKEDTTGVPSWFTELEYLEKNVQDNSYIDLGYKANITTTTELEFSANSWVNNASYNPQVLFGSMNSDNSSEQYTLLAFCETTDNPSVRIVRGASLGTATLVNSLVVNPNQKYKFRLSPENLTIDDTLINTYSEKNDITTTNLYMFRVNASSASSTLNTYYSNANSCVVGKIYTLKIYEGETLVRDYIPVQRKDNLVYGLFDKVTRTFLPVSLNSSFTGVAKE